MITKVENKKQLKQFIHYIKDLYKNDPHMVYPIFSVLTKELTKEVLETKKYTAILSLQDGEIKGRLLYTIDESKKKDMDIGYFSYFDCVNDEKIANELFDYCLKDLKSQNINYLEGTFTPYDPDNRRGVLIKGFDSDPIIFTTYNYEYYGELLEKVGLTKAIDTVLLNAEVGDASRKRLNTFSKFFNRSHDVRVDSLDYKNFDRDIDDVHEILIKATTDIVYQDAPSIDLIRDVAKQMKLFINPDFVRIARENKTNKPVGFCFVLPDFNQIFKKTKGHIRPIRMLLGKKKITRARGMMQYIVPEYQNTGLIAHIYQTLFNVFVEQGYTHFEGGTMMEDNPKPINAFKKFGGEIIKIYRIYGREF
ncbi:hypothetical protein KQ51_00989 [Candidatus Izimaplasma bacterium HR1]|jgi:hypothetical protein|uniref:hypothetical protein n=1 Tax=Candidatus Izimoplasma sp. HR1 TaxID=1541959 RepID=UPI0004F68A1F|nr:hypothetical protein KQ51_00989 [Candidatus Izimaplasma bacterium HR1]